MQLNFFGNDLGIFIFGREILKKFPQTEISFYLTRSTSNFRMKKDFPLDKKIFSEQDFWKTSLKKILKSKIHAEPIGICYDSRNLECHNFFHITPKKSEEKNQIKLFPYKLLKNFADEGLTDTVEFRRLARKFLRIAKSHNCKSLYFPEIIFGEDKTKKILQHLVGSQVKILTTADFFMEELLDNSPPQSPLNSKAEDKRNINIFYNPKEIFLQDLKKLSEKLLKTKIADNDFKILK